MLIVKSCCWAFSLETGVIIILIGDLVLSVLTLLNAILYFTEFLPNCTLIFVPRVIISMFAVFLAFYGIYKKNVLFLVPILCFLIITNLYDLLDDIKEFHTGSTIIESVLGKHTDEHRSPMRPGVRREPHDLNVLKDLLGHVLVAYFILVIFSYIMELSENNPPSSELSG